MLFTLGDWRGIGSLILLVWVAHLALCHRGTFAVTRPGLRDRTRGSATCSTETSVGAERVLLVDVVAGLVTTDIVAPHVLLLHHALHLRGLVRHDHRLLLARSLHLLCLWQLIASYQRLHMHRALARNSAHVRVCEASIQR